MINHKIKFNFFKIVFVILILFLGFSGCSDNAVQTKMGGQSGTTGNLTLSSVRIANTHPSNVLVLNEAKIMLKDIKLHAEDEGEGEGHDDNVMIGPVIVQLKLSGAVNLVTSSNVPPNSYERVIFQIHKLVSTEINTPDPDFIDPDGTTYSVVVKGVYNGTDFIFKSSISVNQKLEFPRLLVVNANSVANFTLMATPEIWFMNNSGIFLDPSDPANRTEIESNIRNNIRNSIEAFEDNDHNGHPDGG